MKEVKVASGTDGDWMASTFSHFESAMRVGAIVEEGAEGFRRKGIDQLLSDELDEVCILEGGDAEVSDAGELWRIEPGFEAELVDGPPFCSTVPLWDVGIG